MIPQIRSSRRATLLAGLLLLAPTALGQLGPHRDADGGLDGDYSGIARLRWAGPGQPDTYEEYLARRGSEPFTSRFVSSVGGDAGRARSAKVLVLVNTGLHAAVQTELDTYVADLAQKGYAVELYEVSGGSAPTLKSFLLAHATDLFGCVFVGDQAAAWYECDIWGYESFPCDLYLMDLDGTWADANGNGKFDQHSAGTGDVGPEIFVGRIDASMMSGDEGATTRAYFDKNHAYRTGAFLAPRHGLTYTEDDWAGSSEMRNSIGLAYPSYTAIAAPDTTRDDYVGNRLPDPAHEFIQLACHSSPSVHAFTRGGSASSWAVNNAPPVAVFYNLFCCSSLRFTSADFIGGAYIYDTGAPGLAVVGSTKTGSMLQFPAFYGRLDTEVFGEAFRHWFNALAPYSNDEIAWHYGMTIAGDPMLEIGRDFLEITAVTELADTTDETTPRTVQADLTVEYAPPVTSPELYWRSGRTGAYTAVPMTLVAGDTYEAQIPGILSPTEVEYYVQAEDALGRSRTFPLAAPEEVLAYAVGLCETILADSFEASSGWTHGADTGTDDWQRSAEEGITGTAGEAGDPYHAYDGDNLWGTDIGAGVEDGYYASSSDRWLRSPILDLSESTMTTLRFHRWLRVASGSGDVARVLVNGQPVWQSPADADLVDAGWKEVALDLSAFDGAASARVEFRLTSDGSNELGGWNLDLVRVTGIGESDACLTASYCTAKTNSLGIVPAIGSTGTPSYVQGDFELTLDGGIPGQAALYLWGSGPHDFPFQGGTLCVKPPQTRSNVRMIDAAAHTSWPITVTPAMAGTTRYYQVWFRDPGDPTTVGLSDGLEARFCDW